MREEEPSFGLLAGDDLLDIQGFQDSFQPQEVVAFFLVGSEEKSIQIDDLVELFIVNRVAHKGPSHDHFGGAP